VIGLALWTTTAAQQQPTFRAATRTVSVPVVVTDAWGHVVRSLTKDDFEIRDNNKLQTITIFDQQTRPIAAVLLLDGSASMLSALKVGIAEVDDFVVRLMPGDEARIGSFSEDVDLGQRFTSNRDELLGYFSNEFNVRIGRRTRLWDAVDQAMTALSTVEGRKVVVVFSDGIDTRSMTRFSDVESHARHLDVSICAIIMRNINRTGQALEMARGPDGSAPGVRKVEPLGALQLLAEETGGGVILVNQLDEVHAPFTQLSLELHSEFVLGFTPDVLDGKVHKLDVRVKPPDLKVRARTSYAAVADGKS
jgi:Ca-activated chloride channel family protein